MRTSLKFLFLVLATALISQGTLAAEECLKAEDVNPISEDFKFQTTGDGFEMQPCQPQNRLTKILRALIQLKKYPHQNFVTDKFDANIISPNPYEFFRKRIQTIILDGPKDNACAQGALAYVAWQGKSVSEIHVCPAFNSMDWFSAAAILLHEARHSDGHLHAYCANGMGGQLAACDDSYEVAGSYAVDTEFYVKATRTKGLHPALRDQAYSQAIENFFLRFNAKPFGLKQGALLKTKESKVLFYADGAINPLPIQMKSSDMIAPTDRGLFVYRAASDKLAYADFTGANERVASQDKLFQMVRGPDKNLKVLDVLASRDYVCALTEKSVRCWNGRIVMELKIDGFKPLRLLAPTQSKFLKTDLIYVSAEDGYVYAMVGQEKWAKSPNSMNISYTQLIDEQTELILHNDGRVLKFNVDKETWGVPTALKNLKVDQIFYPFLWSPELSKF